MSGSSSDLVGRSSYRYTHSSEQSQNRSTIETPSMNPHNDCISFLAVAQYYEVDFVFMTWETGRGKVGSGATSEIWQSSVSRRIDFAFKRTKLAERSSTDSQDEEKAYNAMVSEISVLRHPLIQHHQNIVNLEGICWEIPAQSEKVWPVLLLEKAQLGDLESFMLSAEGKAMTMHERLGICSDVANAIIALHSKDISHGDLKPTNALVFRDGAGDTYAKLADFGYAGWAIGNTDNIVVHPPRSWPWNAPEYHHRGFTVSAAIKMDVYSFGLLCLWLLFFDKQSLITAADIKNGSQWPLEDFETLNSMKYEDTLRDFACVQVESTQGLSANEKRDLIYFFMSAIVNDPHERASDLNDLVVLLGHSWRSGPTSLDAEQKEIDHTLVEFRIAQSYYPLMKQHLRVQNYIFTCLYNQGKGFSPRCYKANDAFQIAFCYKTGFGTPADERTSLYWLKEAQRCKQDLDKEVSLARDTMNRAYHRNGVLQSLSFDRLFHDITIQYNRDELRKVEANYCQVIHDTERVFGQWNCCVVELKLKRASILEAAREFKEAEVLRIRLLQDFKTDPGSSQLSLSLDPRSIYLQLETRQWMRFEETPDGPPLLSIESPADLPLPMETTKSQGGHAAIDSILDCLNERIPQTIELLDSLAINFMGQQRWSEAESIFLHLTKNRVEHLGQSHPNTFSMAFKLATVYETQGLWSKAERIYLHILYIHVHILGEHHRETLRLRAVLAQLYGKQSRLAEAEQLMSQVLATQRSVLGELDLSTLESMRGLAVIYSDQGHVQMSLELKHQLVDKLTQAVGPEHSETLSAMSLVCVDLAKLDRWSETKEMTTHILKRKEAVLGSEHPEVVSSIQHLAAVHFHEGLLQESEAELMHVLQAECKVFGETNPKTIGNRLNLAVVIKSQGRLGEAQRLVMKALESSEKDLGEKHEFSLRAADMLASIYFQQSHLEEAERLNLRVIALAKDTLGEKHPDYLGYESSLAKVRCEQKRFKEAEDIALRVLRGSIDVLGEDHSHTISARMRLADYLSKQRRWEESNAILAKVIEQRKRLVGDEHDDTLWAMRLLALNTWNQGHWKEAIAGIYRSSRIVRALRPFCRHVWCDTNYTLLLPGVFAVGMITYKWRKYACRLGLSFCT